MDVDVAAILFAKLGRNRSLAYARKRLKKPFPTPASHCELYQNQINDTASGMM